VKPRLVNTNVAVVRIEQCVADIKKWTRTNVLKLYYSKTEVIAFGSIQQPNVIVLHALVIYVY